eukprot:CAMPEP_0194046196 /NCGR_PEP_ID=MMETSP0009_2-20130614/20039_1 /TAXON_ID=210454 /ORGANISM="Grammatophora oceanica, Strain CCMP 410" /LENGTH=414 /DNA_ID=CAMNT_0038691397 /DNA_START=27 /DNA_END=1271 /DNA_ORIENTATION=+
MVSQLSSRLLAGYSPEGSVRSGSSSPSSDGGGGGGNRKSVSESGQSGYSADKESDAAPMKPFIFNTKPPVQIDFHRKSKRAPTDFESREKRRKMDEENYVAFSVREDLKKGGLSYPTVRADRPRAIPLAKNLDMSRVTLLSSKSVSDSPFLTPARTPQANGTPDIVTAYGTLFNEVFKSATASYYATTSQSTKSSAGGSDAESTSSVSDSGSDDSTESKMVVISARLDDTLQPTKAKPKKKQQQAPALTSLIACPPSMSMTMEEAIGVCDAARIITTSSSDHTIVHTNAAYSQLTAIHLHTLKGRPLFDAVASGTPTRPLSLACCAAASSEGRHERIFAVCQKDKTQPHLQLSMKVTPIMPFTSSTTASSPAESAYVTHYCIDLIEDSGNVSGGDYVSSEEEDGVAPVHAMAIG